ncbi:MAG: hypothetical protein OEM82_08950 [Acidobacteriota bacterium]|nr:hypothetical protein [Acidobacteriota bacterium]MDH3527929.1 hypothetical protein [Acidobacteriota bacterium]
MIIKVAIIALSLALTAGCLDAGNENSTGETANPESGSSDSKPTVADNKETSEAGLCANEYYPINSETKRKYLVTGEIPGNYILSQKDVKPDSFSELRDFGSGLKVDVNWICTEDGLRTAEFTNTASFMKGNFKMETLESSGITLPKVWENGKEWESTYKIKANLSAGPASGAATGTVTITSKIASMNDRVKVGGKEYEAAKVDNVMRMDLSMNGRKIPSRDVKMTNWMSKEIGLVKQSANTQFGKSGIEYIGKE